MNPFQNIISHFHSKNILVIGDIILDQYIQGSVSRISPEAPVPVVLQEKSFYTPGGSANVAHNLSSLGAKVTMVGRVGDDIEGKILRDLLAKREISTEGIFADGNIPTPLKTRIIAQHQQVVRVDREKIHGFENDQIHEDILNFLKDQIFNFDGIILSDYGKGVVTPQVIELTCQLAQQYKKVITVDPKVENFNLYKKVTGITPNKIETENAIRFIKIKDDNAKSFAINTDKLTTDDQINQAGQELLKYLELDSLLVTLGEHGMRLFEPNQKPFSIATQAREVFDVSGAGDTVISVYTLALCCGAGKQQAAQIANAAAGVVVGKMGAVAITEKELVEAIEEIY